MDSLQRALDFSQLPSIDFLLAELKPDTEAVVRLLLPRTPLLHLLNDLDNLADEKSDPPQRPILQNILRLAIARHDYTKRLFARLTEAIAQPSTEEAITSLADIPAEDVRLALEMLGFANHLLDDAKLHDKAAFTFQIALSLADRFNLSRNRAVVLNQLGFYEEQRGRLQAAEAALKEASEIFARVEPSLVRQNTRLRVRIFLRRLLYEEDPPAPDDFDALLATYPELQKILLPVLARRAIEREDFAAAEKILSQLRASLDPALPVPSEVLLVEAKLARRLGRVETAELLLAEAADATGAAEKDELLRERYYFARDFGKEEQARALLAELYQSKHSAPSLYQDAILCFQNDKIEEAEKLLLECLDQTTDETLRANCYGTLGKCVQSAADGMRYFYAAIGLYLKLGRDFDHAISLSHLAIVEIMHAKHRAKLGIPLLRISEFTRADHLLRTAQEIGERIGAIPFVAETIRNRAILEWDRGRHHVALEHFAAAARQVELNYLVLSDRQQAEAFFERNAGLFDGAIRCAAEVGKARDVLRFSEHSKARRLLRDAAELTFGQGAVADVYKSHFARLPPGALKEEALSEAENLLVTVVRPLRTRLLQGRPISVAERRALHDAQVQVATTTIENVKGRPLGWEDLRPALFGTPAQTLPSEEAEEIQELPGGSVIVCGRCKVYNKIGSSFCSACETAQPKTATINLNLALGVATPQEEKDALAHYLYNRSIEMFHEWKIEEAEDAMNNAMKLTSHPDFSFFHGLYRLAAADAAGALADFQTVKSLQYAEKYPFWPLPVSPSELDRALEVLEADPTGTEAVLEDLIGAYAELSARRAEASL
jgi:tetratricopeptide (TPR) repeat protein